MEKLAYTVRETAEALNIGVNTAYELVNSKNFPKINIGRKIIVPIKQLEKWLENNSVKA